MLAGWLGLLLSAGVLGSPPPAVHCSRWARAWRSLLMRTSAGGSTCGPGRVAAPSCSAREGCCSVPVRQGARRRHCSPCTATCHTAVRPQRTRPARCHATHQCSAIALSMPVDPHTQRRPAPRILGHGRRSSEHVASLCRCAFPGWRWRTKWRSGRPGSVCSHTQISRLAFPPRPAAAGCKPLLITPPRITSLRALLADSLSAQSPIGGLAPGARMKRDGGRPRPEAASISIPIKCSVDRGRGAVLDTY
jgi:hypothetical protein